MLKKGRKGAQNEEQKRERKEGSKEGKKEGRKEGKIEGRTKWKQIRQKKCEKRERYFPAPTIAQWAEFL